MIDNAVRYCCAACDDKVLRSISFNPIFIVLLLVLITKIVRSSEEGGSPP
jgi:hypothetical protein